MKARLQIDPAGTASVAVIQTRELRIALATETDRQRIYQVRHDVYARELGQHPCNDFGALSDKLDAYNVYLVGWQGDELAGFVSITPPGRGSYSVEKYFSREALPFALDGQVHEIRLLTVVREKRRRKLAPLLMYAALRWVEAHGGTRVMAIGRQEIISLYHAAGLISTGLWVKSGRVSYELLHAPVETIRAAAGQHSAMLDELEREADWQLDFPFRQPAACFHGGAFFKAIGERFGTLERAQEIINADVLDAWFPPSPKVLAALREHLPWLLRTSPPADARGLVETIAEVRGVPAACVLPGAGSSDLIFLALRHWLRPESRVLILDPMYGEYAHVLERVIGCHVDRLELYREENYEVSLSRLASALLRGYDLMVLVNPNSPTGRHVSCIQLEECLRLAPATTRVWVDETYVDYVGGDESLERFAAASANVVVCKSMSKVYALSGVRSAYLVGAPTMVEELRSITPPWAVGLPAQVAAVNALMDPEYYAARHAETNRLRQDLSEALSALGMEVVPGCANFLLAHLPPSGPPAEAVVAVCRERGLFLRNAAGMGTNLGSHALRIAVKDAVTNRRIIEIMASVLTDSKTTD